MNFLWLLEGIRTPLFDQLMQFITYFGQEILILAVICTLYWCVDKRFAYILGFTYFIAGLCVQTLKVTFRIPRPWILDPNFTPVESAVPAATGYSFPSGHTQGGTSLYFPMLLKAKRNWVKVLFAFIFILIGFSRMYLGVHTPKDVLTSIGLSILISLLVWKYQTYFLDDDRYRKQIMLCLVLIAVLVGIYALFLNANGIIELKYAKDCCKAAGAGLGFGIGWYIEKTYLNFETREKTITLQVVKLFTGLLVSLLIKEGFSLVFGTSILAKICEYFILVMWVLVFYPLIFTKVLRR